MDFVRGVVSKKKVRYVDHQHGFNLDLTYIPTGVPFPGLEIDKTYSAGKKPERTQLIAMGFPSEGTEGLYRNPIKEVRRFFNLFHKDKFKIYNLCSEKAYEVEKLFTSSSGPGSPPNNNISHARTARYGFDDHNPPPLALMLPFCNDLEKWLAEDPENVASIHCKAGKGRTGTLICVYLVHSGRYTAEEALESFGNARTANGKGVTIPSQQRYVYYYEQMRLRSHTITEYTFQILHIRLVQVPTCEGALQGYGCEPSFSIFQQAYTEAGGECLSETTKIYDFSEHSAIRHFKKDERFVDLDCSDHGVLLKGDIKLQFYHREDKICHVWFNTAFIENNYLCFEKTVVDKACRDKDNARFDPNFKIEIYLKRNEMGTMEKPSTRRSLGNLTS